ncbi:MAG: DUF2807 domain-containing protein, partial [Gemmatimonadales bacterium]
EAEGVVDVQDIRVVGAGNYQASGVMSRTAIAEVSDIGLAWVQVADTLWASVRDAGTVQYRGDPDVIEDISGKGKIF